MKKIVLLFFTFVVVGCSVTAASRPNIVFIYTDDQAPFAVRAAGDERLVTPHIDRIFREAPLEAIADEDWEPGRDIDFSADYEAWPAGSPRLQCRLYGVLRDANCPRKAAYDQIAGTIRRQA